MSLSNLGDLLKSRFGGSVGMQISDAVLCDTFDALVKDWFEGKFEGHVRAAHVRDGVLTISVDHSLYAEKLKAREKDILATLNEKAGKLYVHSIAFLLLV